MLWSKIDLKSTFNNLQNKFAQQPPFNIIKHTDHFIYLNLKIIFFLLTLVVFGSLRLGAILNLKERLTLIQHFIYGTLSTFVRFNDTITLLRFMYSDTFGKTNLFLLI